MKPTFIYRRAVLFYREFSALFYLLKGRWLYVCKNKQFNIIKSFRFKSKYNSHWFKKYKEKLTGLFASNFSFLLNVRRVIYDNEGTKSNKFNI